MNMGILQFFFYLHLNHNLIWNVLEIRVYCYNLPTARETSFHSFGLALHNRHDCSTNVTYSSYVFNSDLIWEIQFFP